MMVNADHIQFDEPTSAPRPEWVGEVPDLMRRVAGRGQTMLIVTPEMQFARKIADRIVFLHDDRIVGQGLHADLLGALKAQRTAAFQPCSLVHQQILHDGGGADFVQVVVIVVKTAETPIDLATVRVAQRVL
ncbi:hypothetical protein SAMN04488003_1192 [Loktanella fryxellensis]|uniref:Uncharacterized protein n=1 Tax=Loktanella fryxellensis TaxID=245187 RepID=A0A1H8H240_9RHOB|nr:hypothetical protein SAMN04488003_1192 [Loktanella fryxellensis]